MTNNKSYAQDTKDFAVWFADFVVLNVTSDAPFRDLYASYREWALAEGIIPDSSASFSRKLRAHLQRQVEQSTVKIVNNKGILYKGLEVAPAHTVRELAGLHSAIF